MRIAIASDHAALELKTALCEWLIAAGHEVADLGPYDATSVDYPDYGYLLAGVVAEGTAERGDGVRVQGRILQAQFHHQRGAGHVVGDQLGVILKMRAAMADLVVTVNRQEARIEELSAASTGAAGKPTVYA